MFAFSEVKLGIVPAVISPFALRKIGESAARRLLRHRRALRRGDRARDRARARGDRRPRRGARADPRRAPHRRPRAARHAKRLVLDRPDGTETARRIAERRTSDEGQEGLRAFLERRARPGRRPTRRRALTAREAPLTAVLAIASALLIGGADFIGGFLSRSFEPGAGRGARAGDRAGPGDPCGARRRRRARDRRRRGVVGRERRRCRPRARPVLHRDDTRHDQPRRAGHGRDRSGRPCRLRARHRASAPARPRSSGSCSPSQRSRSSPSRRTRRRGRRQGLGALPLAFGAGLLFGLFYVCLAHVHEDAGMWPVAISRVASTAVVVALALAVTRGVAVSRDVVPRIALIGVSRSARA